MDDRTASLAFRPDRRYTALAGVGALAAVTAAVLTTQTTGRLLAGIAAIVLAGYVLTDLVFSPRLVVTSDGVAVNAPLARFSLSWHEVERIRPDTRTRYGLRATTLEVDGGDRLAVLSRRALGADPQDVAALAEALRPR